MVASTAEGGSCFLLLPTLDVLGGFNAEVYQKLANRWPWIVTVLPESRPGLAALLLTGVICLLLVKITTNYFSSLLTTNCVRTFTNELRSMLFERILSFSKLYFDRVSFGQQQEVITTYVAAVAIALSTLQGVAYAGSCLVVYAGILIYLSPQLTLFVSVVLPVMWFITRVIVRKLTVTSREHAAQYNELGRALSNTLGNIPLIKAYTAEAGEAGRFRHLCQRVAALERSLDKKSLMIAPAQEVCTIIMLIAVLLFVGISASGSKSQLAENLVFLVVLRRATALISVFGMARGAMAAAAGPTVEVFSILTMEDETRVTSGNKPAPASLDEVEFRDVSLTYPGGCKALSNLSVVLKRGEMVGIVGSSGSGKSSLIGILMKFYEPGGGGVYVNGVPLSELNTESWLSRVAYVGQDAYLFHGSVRENLLFGSKEQLSDEYLWDALERAHLGALVRSLPSGLETLVGERGVQLSGGERQRLSLARAIMKKADLWILDEPTSALDGETERQVQLDLEEILGGATTIMIAHRLSTLKHADRILVIEGGKLVDDGSIHDLLARQGRFTAEWKAQGLDSLA